MKQHPSAEMLARYAEGSLDACNALIVASHIERCHHCRDQVSELEAQLAEDELVAVNAETNASAPIAADLGALLSSITSKTQHAPSLNIVQKPCQVEVNGKTFDLPIALKGIAPQLQDWRSYGGKVFSASFDIGEDERVSLLYITEGVQVPQHTHKGTEATLVLEGAFEDENGTYSAGDFMLEDGETLHTPRTAANQDCLCLTVLTQPMVFTQGLARVFNLFGRGMYP